MASASSPIAAGFGSGRALEWGILLAVLLALIGVYGQQTRSLQAQAELATIQSTVGALRTSLVIAHLHSQVRPGAQADLASQRNPFKVLDTPPANYAGLVAMSDIVNVAPGSWVFDQDCACVGYRPLNPQWLTSATASPALWFRVSPPPGVLQLTPLEAYSWQGQVIN